MKKITDMSQDAVALLRVEITAALKKVADAHGLIVIAGGGSYDPMSGTYSPKVEFKTPGAAVFAAQLLDLDPKLIGKMFVNRGRRFKITGFNLNRPKFCVIAEDLSGRTLFFPRGVIAKVEGGKR